MKTEMLLFVFPAMVLLLIARIIFLVMSGSSSYERKSGGLVNLGFVLFYSALCWYPALTYEETYSDLPSIDLGPVALIFLWFFILFFHSLIYWVILEVKTYHSKTSFKKHNQNTQA